MSEEFYRDAFVRNLGLVTQAEQERLRGMRVAIAGMGGLGGRYLLDMVRMGIGKFTLADFDEFSIKNINRQVGATASTAGRPKIEVMAEMARDIHPDVDLRCHGDGLTPENAEAFVADADVVLDAIDMFSMPARTLLHQTARRLGKSVIIGAPLGFSGTLHVFTPDSMSFEDYFDLDEAMPLFDQMIAFAVGLTPAGTHWSYLDTSKVDAADHAGPSLSCACNIATGLVTSEALILLLGKRPPLRAPHYVQFDTLKCQYRRGTLRWGNRGPVQRLKRYLAAKKFASQRALLEQATGQQ